MIRLSSFKDLQISVENQPEPQMISQKNLAFRDITLNIFP